jgi:hypothetical protein
VRPACLVVGGNWLRCLSIICSFSVGRPTSPGAFLFTLLFSVPTPRPSTCLDDRGRGNEKMKKLYEPSAIPPKMTYRFPLGSFTHHVASTTRHLHAPRNVEGNACPGTSFLDFSIELSERLVTISGKPSPLHIFPSILYILEHTIIAP